VETDESEEGRNQHPRPTASLGVGGESFAKNNFAFPVEGLLIRSVNDVVYKLML
jgi:hypothetical protein